MSEDRKPSFLWQSRLLGRSGYATLAREMLRGLHARSFAGAFRPFGTEPEKDPETRGSRWYREMLAAPVLDESAYIIFHTAAGQSGASYFHEAREMNPGHGRYIGYTMFETDRIPASWVDACDAMDEIWVPTKFNRETFSRSGVPIEKIRVMPFGVDPLRFDPAKRKPFSFPTQKPFRFLSIFEWAPRKGWDALLRAYAQEFRREDPVSLVLCSYRGDGINSKEHPVRLEDEIDRFLQKEFGMSRAQAPEIVLLEERIPDERWPDLFSSADAFVLPTRGEGWGVPYTEAAISGLPILATAWGAQTEYLNPDCAYLIEVEKLAEVSFEKLKDNRLFAGHRWAEPSVSSLRRHMRHVFECRDEAKEKGRRAREAMLSGFTVTHAVDRVAARLQEIDASFRVPVKPARVLSEPKKAAPFRFLWIGDDPEEQGLRLALACFCANFEAGEEVEFVAASHSAVAAKEIEETIESFRPLTKSRMRFAGVATDLQGEELWREAGLFLHLSSRVEESPLVREAMRRGVCVLAMRDTAPVAARSAACGLLLSARKVPIGKGPARRPLARPSANTVASVLRWAVSHRESLAAKAREAQERLARSSTEPCFPLLYSESMPPLPAPWTARKMAASAEMGGFSGAVNRALRSCDAPFAAIVQGRVSIPGTAIEKLEADPRAVMLHGASKDGAYAIVRPYRALAYASLDEAFSSFDALREWVRAVRAAGAVVIDENDQRTSSLFENEKDDGAIAFLELADALAAKGKRSEAIAAARQALLWKPGYFEALLFLGQQLLATEETAPEARELLVRAVALRPNDVRVRHLLGKSFAQEQDFTAALSHLRIAAQMDPENAEIWNDFGVVQGSLGQLRESLQSLDRSRRIDASNADAWSNGAEILEALGEAEQARLWRERAQSCVGAS